MNCIGKHSSVKRENNDKVTSLIDEAMNMYLWYEEKYYALLMVCYDDDARHNRILDELQRKSEYWRDIHETLLRKIG